MELFIDPIAYAIFLIIIAVRPLAELVISLRGTKPHERPAIIRALRTRRAIARSREESGL